MECFTCEVNNGQRSTPGETSYRDGLWVADHGIPALVRGYLVLKPERHVLELADLAPEEALRLGTAAQRVTAAMRAALHPERVYVCSFVETVPHLHFHLLPRYHDMPPLGPALVGDLFSERWAVSEREAEQAAVLIRDALVSLASS